MEYRIQVWSSERAARGEGGWTTFWSGTDSSTALLVARHQIKKLGPDVVLLEERQISPWRSAVIPYPPDHSGA